MAGDLLRRVEVLRDQRRRHHQRVAGVGEPFARRAVDGELAGRVERVDAGQVAERVGVFGVVEPAEDHPPGVAGPPGRLGREEAAGPIAGAGPARRRSAGGPPSGASRRCRASRRPAARPAGRSGPGPAWRTVRGRGRPPAPRPSGTPGNTASPAGATSASNSFEAPSAPGGPSPANPGPRSQPQQQDDRRGAGRPCLNPPGLARASTPPTRVKHLTNNAGLPEASSSPGRAIGCDTQSPGSPPFLAGRVERSGPHPARKGGDRGAIPDQAWTRSQ